MGPSSPIVTRETPFPTLAEGYGIRHKEAQAIFDLGPVKTWLESQIGEGWTAEFESPLGF